MLSNVKVPVLFTHHFRQVDENSGTLMGAISDLQVRRVQKSRTSDMVFNVPGVGEPPPIIGSIRATAAEPSSAKFAPQARSISPPPPGLESALVAFARQIATGTFPSSNYAVLSLLLGLNNVVPETRPLLPGSSRR
jgi:hypothetical protein